MRLKKPLTIDEQIEKFRQHDLIIDDEKMCKQYLAECGYYRLSGFGLQYRLAPNNSNYVQGTNFTDIIRLYHFDQKLRDVLRKYIEVIEVFYRTQIAYHFSLQKCGDPPHNQHYNAENYFNKKSFQDFISRFHKHESYHVDNYILQHHKKKYGGKMPLWAMMELASFSDVSKLYSSMYHSEQEVIAGAIGIGRETLKNHLHCLSVLRNKCAHAARLYNSKFNPPVKFSTKFWRNYPEVKGGSLFAYILVLIERLPNPAAKVQCIKDITEIIDEYHDIIDFDLIKWPQNYGEVLKERFTIIRLEE